MNTIKRVLQKIADESNGKMRLVTVPDNRIPTAESLKKLETEIHTQVESNRAMEYRSYINASKRF